MTVYVYIATVHKDIDSDYGVQFYDFPGCISAGSTIEGAKEMATEALTGHISLIIEDEDEIPAPSSLEVILADPDHADAVAFLAVEVANTLLQGRQKLSLV
jgi:predicted RNase H-like HicB family nuclease